MISGPPTVDEVLALAERDPVVRGFVEAVESDKVYLGFEPRPDDTASFDEQHSFCFNRDQVSFMVGGNASGTTECASFKTAQFLLHQQPPPRKDTPFWIIAETYDQVMDVCWAEKLMGHGHIPECEVQWERVAWHSSKQDRPKNVPLKPWPEEFGGCPTKNWRIEFKSYEQGRQAMQARSIGGFWFSEQFPLDIFLEVLRGCREYMFPGGQFAEFTPVDPVLSIWVEKAMEDQPPGWKFYRCNTALNVPNLEEGWYDQFFALVPDEMRATRETGALASFEGVIYPSFLPSLHVIDEHDLRIPIGTYHDMGSDWGASTEHPHATLFGCRDSIGSWLIYDEYWSNDQSKITKDHVEAIMEKCQRWGWPMQTYRIAVSQGSTRELKPSELPLPHEVIRERTRISPTRDALWGQNYGDPARPGEINEFSKRGIPTLMARNQVFAGIDEVRTVFKCHPETGEPGILISSRCKHLIEELRKYRWKKGRRPESGTILNPQVATPTPLKRDDDMVDALRYLIFSKALPTSETVQSTKKTISAADRKSVQLVRSKLERALRRSVTGIIPRR